MTLTTIEYGSLASSDTLNQNFGYLDTRITGAVNTLNSSISSILSNIATINSRLGTLSNSVSDLNSDLSSDINTLKTNVQTGINSLSMQPNWANCTTISLSEAFTAPKNGYLILIPVSSTSGTITVNSSTITAKNVNASSDNAATLMTIPVKKNDVVTSTCSFANAYFLPVNEITITI